MPKQNYSAAGGVVIANGLMLLLDRPARGEMRLPKGHIEPDEDAETAAMREVGEESGYVDLVVLADLGHQVVEFDFDGRHVVRDEQYFLMSLRSDAQIERDGKDAAQFIPVWRPLTEAIALLTYTAEQETARRAVATYYPQPPEPQ